VNFSLSHWPTLENGSYTKKVDLHLLRLMILEVLSELKIGGEARNFCNFLKQVDTVADAILLITCNWRFFKPLCPMIASMLQTRLLLRIS
jgi:hypothetical protein